MSALRLRVALITLHITATAGTEATDVVHCIAPRWCVGLFCDPAWCCELLMRPALPDATIYTHMMI